MQRLSVSCVTTVGCLKYVKLKSEVERTEERIKNIFMWAKIFPNLYPLEGTEQSLRTRNMKNTSPRAHHKHIA